MSKERGVGLYINCVELYTKRKVEKKWILAMLNGKKPVNRKVYYCDKINTFVVTFLQFSNCMNSELSYDLWLNSLSQDFTINQVFMVGMWKKENTRIKNKNTEKAVKKTFFIHNYRPP